MSAAHQSTATMSEERRLVRVIGAVVFVDTMFYAAIAPLLPTLAHELHLSKLSAGVMTASYPLGTLVGALPGGVLAARAGPKFTVCAGLALLGLSSVAFGFLNDAAALDAARFVEGVGGACSWAGGIAWIVADAPQSRRGGLIGGALGAAIAGALFGPVIGTVANAVGRKATFSAVMVVSLVLIALAARLRAPAARSGQGMRQLRSALASPTMIAGMWLVALPALVSGVLDVLAPLRLHHLGATSVAIGATFLVAAGVESFISPVAGRLSDRRGRFAPLRLGLAASGAVLLCVPLPDSPLALAVVVVLVAATLGMFWAPAMAWLSELAEGRHLDQALAAALMNLAWAGGQIVGAGAGGALGKAAGDGVAFALAAALCWSTLLTLAHRASRPASAGAAR